MVELFYAEDDAHIAGVVKKYLEQKNFKVVTQLSHQHSWLNA